MSPVTHFLASWVIFERAFDTRRDRILVVASGVVPDLDGMGIVIDFMTRALGMPETDYYHAFHRLWGHGLAPAFLLSILAALWADRRVRMLIGTFLCLHLHYLCDILGSRGSTEEDLWGIYYFAPFSTAHELTWSGQWPLVSWQNTLITLVLLAIIFTQAVRRGYSALGLFSTKADEVFVQTLRLRFGHSPH